MKLELIASHAVVAVVGAVVGYGGFLLRERRAARPIPHYELQETEEAFVLRFTKIFPLNHAYRPVKAWIPWPYKARLLTSILGRGASGTVTGRPGAPLPRRARIGSQGGWVMMPDGAPFWIRIVFESGDHCRRARWLYLRTDEAEKWEPPLYVAP
jgi:hypothetical protein